MKKDKQIKQPLRIGRETIRSLDTPQLTAVVGGSINSSVKATMCDRLCVR